MKRAPAAAALALALLLPAGPALAAGRPVRRQAAGVADLASVQRARYLMGTVCTVQAAGVTDTATLARAVDDGFEEIARLEQVMSSWRDDSELARLNAAADADRAPCSADLYAVLDSALALAAETEGAFDPTVEPLNRAWDLRGEGRVPGPGELSDARARVDWRKVVLDPERRTARFLRAGMGLDLGGIGKGFALDHAAAQLRARGVRRALLNFGGEVLAFSRGAPWTITVADPADRLRPVVRLALTEAAVSTSSQGERFVEVNGTRYGHVLDPRRGAPLTTPGSVTVVAGSGTRADALSTALLVMGREEAGAWAGSHTGVGVLWLEPGAGAVRAWAWNLPAIAAEPGARVDWMTR